MAQELRIDVPQKAVEMAKAEEKNKLEKHCIYKLPACVTDLNKKAYKPRCVSFGPYHHDDPKLKPMEPHKSRVVVRFLERSGKSMPECIKALSDNGVDEQLRDAYDSLDPKWRRKKRQEFLSMMVEDGCFVLEILRYSERYHRAAVLGERTAPYDYFKTQYNGNDPMFSEFGALNMIPYITRDMLMLENQLPLLLLKELLSFEGLPETKKLMQKMCCDLEIDVNGQGTFLINKKIIVAYSGRLRKLFRKSKENAGRFKVIFHDFPGGSQSFELILSFCYSGGRLNISSSNIMLLHSAAIFLEMGEDGPRLSGLIREMSWSELLECLKQSQNLLHFISNSVVLQDLMESLVGRISIISAVSPNVSYSTDSSSCKQFSGDISGESTSKYSSQTNNSWFEDLDFLRIDLAEKLVRTMIISKKVDEYTVSCFLFRYQKMKKAEGAEKRKIAETVIILLDLLEEKSLISARCLFDNLQVSMVLRLGKSHKRKVESLIGSVLDRAKLDDLLFPSPSGKSGAYDVDLVSRIQKQFLLRSKKKFIISWLKKVAILMDSYIAEVAPDRCLQPEKFAALATALPAVARDSHDRIYYALDLYLKVHDKICVEEKIKICGVLDYNKLSIGCLMDLCDNMNFPASARMRASFSQSRNLKLGKFPRKMGCVWSFEDDDDSKSTQTSARTLEKLDYQTIDHIFM